MLLNLPSSISNRASNTTLSPKGTALMLFSPTCKYLSPLFFNEQIIFPVKVVPKGGSDLITKDVLRVLPSVPSFPSIFSSAVILTLTLLSEIFMFLPFKYAFNVSAAPSSSFTSLSSLSFTAAVISMPSAL